jgi:hypothetical protein
MITVDQLYAWMGSDTLKVHDLTELLLEVINWQYPVEQIRQDISDYITQKVE